MHFVTVMALSRRLFHKRLNKGDIGPCVFLLQGGLLLNKLVGSLFRKVNVISYDALMK